jgi:hypothetical protein
MEACLHHKFSALVNQIYEAVAALEKLYPGRHFTPDGHMVGSIGEAIAAEHYGIELYPASHAKFDGRKGRKEIQVKATQGASVDLKHGAGTLLVLKIRQDGSFEEIYNGDAARVWKLLSGRKANPAGEIAVSLKRLSILQREVVEAEKISLHPESLPPVATEPAA